MANRRLSSDGKPTKNRVIAFTNEQNAFLDQQDNASRVVRYALDLYRGAPDEIETSELEKKITDLEGQLKLMRARKDELTAKTEAKKKSLSDRQLVKEKCLKELTEIFKRSFYDATEIQKTLKIRVGDYNAHFKDLGVEPFTEEEFMGPLLEAKAVEEKQELEKKLEAKQNRLKDQAWRLSFLKSVVGHFGRANPVSVDKILDEARFLGFSTDLAKSDLLLLKTRGEITETESGFLKLSDKGRV